MKPAIKVVFFMTILLFATLGAMGQQTQKAISSSGYAPVNGLRMYYEVHGVGKPLVLVHGSYMNIDLNWKELIPELSKNRQVIALEMQGHGRTADIDRPYSFPALADDIAGLLKHLEIEQADILGYSFGGTVALEFAIRHPEMASSLIFISSVYKYEGWSQATRDILPTIVPEFFENTPLKTEYDRLAPDPTHWKNFVNKLTKFDTIPFDLGAENIQALDLPVLLIFGDNDGVELEHIAGLYRLLGGGVMGDMVGLPKSRLAVIPGTSHVSLMMETQKLMDTIQPFLGSLSAN